MLNFTLNPMVASVVSETGSMASHLSYCTFDLNWQPLNNWGSLFLSFYKGHYQTKIVYGTPHWVKGAINYAGVDPHGQGPRNKLPQLLRGC